MPVSMRVYSEIDTSWMKRCDPKACSKRVSRRDLGTQQRSTILMESVAQQYGITVMALRGESRADDILAGRREFVKQAEAMGLTRTQIGRLIRRSESQVNRLLAVPTK